MPHAIALTSHLETFGILGAAGLLGNLVGRQLYARARFSEALTVLANAERINRKAHGDDDVSVAISVYNQAHCLYATAQLDEARARYREAASIAGTISTVEPSLGAHLTTWADLGAARVAQETGDLELARGVYTAVPADDRDAGAQSALHLGEVLLQRGELDAALDMFFEAEKTYRELDGLEDPSVATCINNIGVAYLAKGEHYRALPYFLEAERIARRVFGDSHPTVAARLNNVATVHLKRGELDDALVVFRKSEDIKRAVYGNDHPEVARAMGNVGAVLYQQGELDAAMDYFLAAEKIDRAAYGDSHYLVAVRLMNVGSVLSARGDLHGATNIARQAFTILISSLGPRAGHTISAARNLITVGVNPMEIAEMVAGTVAANELTTALQDGS